MATATRSRATTQQELETATARIGELREEAAALPGRMEEALRQGDNHEYLELMIRENANPGELHRTEVEAARLRVQQAEERQAELAAAGPELTRTRAEVYRRTDAVMKAAEQERNAIDALWSANKREWSELANGGIRELRGQLQTLQESGPNV